MAQDGVLVNRVAQSALVTLNLEDFAPQVPVVGLDISSQLEQGLLLREKPFRAWADAHDWAAYQGQAVALHCTTDAIVPGWAYLLLATKLSPYAAHIHHGTPEALTQHLYLANLQAYDWAKHADQKLILKGCGTVPTAVYVEATRHLTPLVDKLMYGEACSMVPLYKRPKAQ